MNWVGQEHTSSCGAACLAMLTGKPYRVVCDEIPGKQWNDWSEGMTDIQIDTLLAGWGYAVARRFAPGDGKWTPEPFAAMHLCVVDSLYMPMRHAVVMLGDGTVLDPAGPDPRRLSDYPSVWSVAAIVPLPPHERSNP